MHILLLYDDNANFEMLYVSPKKVQFRLFVHWKKFVIDLPLQKS